MKKAIIPAALALSLLAGCGGTAAPTASSAQTPADMPAPVESVAPVPTPMAVESSQAPEEALFPRTFLFSSGVGAWSTELDVAEDGSFTGSYHDTDMGDTGEDYPDGTVYICTFSGRFSQPERVDGHTYTMRLEDIQQEETDGEAVIEDGVRYVGSGPYGLDDADEILLYLPGTPKSDMPEGFASWTSYGWGDDDTLTGWGLYNVAADEGFLSMDD
ncbi:hypothetical protein [Pseudoflavonifractor sp. MSJ-37]|uniref:hypothetical protein n=1 Tax=Pseudoflavonifractor sp. MSJ-37 TaxID=2841531 RepID=UPI001C10AFC0|nr:hypothetical protein [Pseudoflavonifractor sp. MSJ-37]MBU5434949.1 hypothetical protein [Pseudoflavonifractor sp. MSJ-37]